jgi:3'-phosphoadenosine 5'-phosphosulfate sulfotransferase (PAPS reductase)/FAD synthetase
MTITIQKTTIDFEGGFGRLSQLDELEAEAISIFREVAAECEHPVLLFSGGKDSAVLLRIAEKASGRAASRSR